MPKLKQATIDSHLEKQGIFRCMGVFRPTDVETARPSGDHADIHKTGKSGKRQPTATVVVMPMPKK